MRTKAPLIVAHRGASADAPENTLGAFQLAWQQGADLIEGDFHITADGVIVCRHDAVVVQGNRRKMLIRDLSYETLKSIPTEHNVPTLEAVLNLVPAGKGIFIEIKCGPEIIQPLLSILSRSQLSREQVTVIAFSESVIAGLKQSAPHLQANWLVDFQYRNLILRPGAEAIIETLRHLKADGVGLKADFRLSRRFVSKIQSAGFTVHVWTVDSQATALHFHDLGVQSITTNVPAKMRLFLNAVTKSS